MEDFCRRSTYKAALKHNTVDIRYSDNGYSDILDIVAGKNLGNLGYF